jgi:ABC-type polysaccharide/polyol phosphate export permease
LTGRGLAGLAFASISFVALGVLASAFVITFRYGAGAMGWLLTALVFGAGVAFPLGLLPEWTQRLSSLSPLTQGLKVVRGALLLGAGWSDVAGSLLALLAGGVVFGAIGWAASRWAVQRAIRRGTLAQY